MCVCVCINRMFSPLLTAVYFWYEKGARINKHPGGNVASNLSEVLPPPVTTSRGRPSKVLFWQNKHKVDVCSQARNT